MSPRRWRESRILNLYFDDGGVSHPAPSMTKSRTERRPAYASALQRTSLESRRSLLSVLLMTLEVADLAERLAKLGAKVTHDRPILRTDPTYRPRILSYQCR